MVRGVRYIDDAVMRQVSAAFTDTPAAGEFPPILSVSWDDAIDEEEGRTAKRWWYLTDVQFSVVGLIDPTWGSMVTERVEYSPYGVPLYQPATDFDGDGDVDVGDESAFLDSWYAQFGGSGIGPGPASADRDRSGAVDVGDLFDFLDAWFADFPVGGPGAPEGWISRKEVPPSMGVQDGPLGPDNPVGYCGYIHNPETGDYTVRFRHYSPRLGRWIERDPAGYVDGKNLMEYGVASPNANTDPSGLNVDPDGSQPAGGCCSQPASPSTPATAPTTKSPPVTPKPTTPNIRTCGIVIDFDPEGDPNLKAANPNTITIPQLPTLAEKLRLVSQKLRIQRQAVGTASCAVLTGHGTPGNIICGTSAQENVAIGTFDIILSTKLQEGSIDPSKIAAKRLEELAAIEEFLSELRQSVDDDGVIILATCETGKDAKFPQALSESMCKTIYSFDIAIEVTSDGKIISAEGGSVTRYWNNSKRRANPPTPIVSSPKRSDCPCSQPASSGGASDSHDVDSSISK
jgi:RHS repeat-associated protein